MVIKRWFEGHFLIIMLGFYQLSTIDLEKMICNNC